MSVDLPEYIHKLYGIVRPNPITQKKIKLTESTDLSGIII